MTYPRVTIDPPSSRQSELCLPLERALDVQACGTKAVNLGRLLRAGLPVPAGFVLTAHVLTEYIAAGDLQTALDRIEQDRAVAGAEREARVRELFAATPLTERLRALLQQLVRQLPGASVFAVRSSAAGEDGAGGSFAGLFSSMLGVAGIEALDAAVREVWASGWSAKVAAYVHSGGYRAAAMAVIVQTQVDARFAGVLFTRSPQAGHEGEMLCEYCTGLAERLVAGEVTPQSVTIARDSFEIGHPVAEGAASGERIEREAMERLASAAAAAERLFGAPQDIEWALDHAQRLWLVQSRPIVVDSARSAASVVWSNANVCENFPGPICPLLYSIAAPGYTHYFRNLGRAFGLSYWRLDRMAHDLKLIIGVHAGRMYYNLSAIHSVLGQVPFGSRLIAWFDDFTGAPGSTADGRPQPSFVRHLRDALELAWIAMRTTWQYARIGQRVARFETRADRYAARTAPTILRSKTLIELRDDLRAFLDIRLNRWTDAALADAAAMVCYGTLKASVARVLPATDCAQVHNALLTGLTGLKSAEPIEQLWGLARAVRASPELRALFELPVERIAERLRADPAFADFNARVQRYLEHWGFRCSGELMLTVASFQEHPGLLLEIVRAQAGGPDISPDERLAAQRANREEATRLVLERAARQRCIPYLPWPSRAPVIRVLLRATQSAIGLRERARYKQALLYSRVRRIALEIGARLVQRGVLSGVDDVFLLTIAEIDDLLSGVAMYPEQTAALVSLRREAHARFAQQAPADTLIAAPGEYPGIHAAGVDAGSSAQAAVFRGRSVCAGSARGPAKVLASVAETHALQPGDILVTGQTDPGWAPAFAAIAGLVLERGGMLSHGAILAREYGIPTVVGIADATKRIPAGTMLEVDGDSGDVRLLA